MSEQTIEKKKNKIRKWSIGAIIGVYVPLIVFALLCLVPFIMVVSTSLTSSAYVQEHGTSIFIKEFSLDAYKSIFLYPDEIIRSYINSIIITILGTFISVFLCIITAYPLSKLDFKYRGVITFFLFISTAFSAGLIPNYILYKNILQIYDSFWVLILPLAGGAGHVIFLRVFFQGLDESYFESARLDGATEFQALFKIAVPLIMPGIATVIFYNIIAYWNDSSSAIYYLDSTSRYMPISVYISRINSMIVYMHEVQNGVYPGITLPDNLEIPEYTIQMAAVVVTTAPILFLFSFFQKYFVGGLTTGGVKS